MPAFYRPELFWTMALEMQRLTGHAEPNGGHAALVELEKLAGVRCVVTQNVDALHQVRDALVGESSPSPWEL
jgi:NAD-dependent SIR2 family protein deacetylase